MKKSKVLMIGAAVAAIAVFTTTAFATTSKTAGYDAFKEVLKANYMSGQTIESATVGGNYTITLDGETVLTADGAMKVRDAGDSHNMSSDFGFTLKGVERSGSLYSSGDDSIYLVDRTHDLHYQVVNLEDDHAGRHHEWMGKEGFQERTMNKAEEVLLDFLVGGLKDNFSVSEHAGGSKTITIDVKKNDIPLPLRLLIDVASAERKHSKYERTHSPKASAEWERMKQLPFFQGLEEIDLEDQLPKLTKDVAIEQVKLQLTVDANNKIQVVQGMFEVRGKDEAGVAHRVHMEGKGEFSDINATTPDVYDPAGKSIEIIDATTFVDRG